MSKEEKILVDTMLQYEIPEVVIRKGDALPVQNLEPVKIVGNIDAPARFASKRTFAPEKSHCLYSVSQGTIELIVNEQEPFEYYVITGQINVSKKFKSLGINNPEISYSPRQLANKLKFLRSLFPKVTEHTYICTTLQGFKANIDKMLEDRKDTRGNTNKVFQETVDSNIPNSFVLNIPLFEGEDKKSIEVNVVLEVKNGDILCFLESLDASDFMEQDMETKVLDEVKKLEDKTTLIAI